MLADVHLHLCSHDCFSDSDAGADVDKVNCRSNCQPLHVRKIAILTVMVLPHCVIPVIGELVVNCDFHRNWKVSSYGYGKSSSLVNSDVVDWSRVN